MRLTFVISSLGAGGAEKVASVLTAAWADRGWLVTVLTFDDGSVPPFHSLDPRIAHRSLGLAADSRNPVHAVVKNFGRIARLRRAIETTRPDRVVSFGDTTNVLTLLATWGRPYPVVVAERVDPEHHSIGPVWSRLRRLTYRRAQTVTVLTDRMARKVPYARRVVVIPNPVTAPDDRGGAAVPLRRPAVVAAGRLAAQKRFSLLVDAFASVAEEYPDWSLYIFGEGPERAALESRAAACCPRGRIFFPGVDPSLPGRLAQADIFVLSSDYEGFPNGLCEAMALGVPVISTDCPTGPREIIGAVGGGVLVETGDVGALAEAMAMLMADEEARLMLGRQARSICAQYDLAGILARWDSVLNGTAADVRDGDPR